MNSNYRPLFFQTKLNPKILPYLAQKQYSYVILEKYFIGVISILKIQKLNQQLCSSIGSIKSSDLQRWQCASKASPSQFGWQLLSVKQFQELASVFLKVANLFHPWNLQRKRELQLVHYFQSSFRKFRCLELHSS